MEAKETSVSFVILPHPLAVGALWPALSVLVGVVGILA